MQFGCKQWAALGLAVSPMVPVAALAQGSAQTAIAQPSDAALSAAIDKIKAAYRIETLKNAQTIRLEEDVRLEYPDHEYGADFHELSNQRRHHIIDFRNERGSSEYLTKIAGTYYHGRSIFAGGNSRFIIYASNIVQDNGASDFIAEYGGTIRSSDVMLAMWLDKAAATARHEGVEMWLGKLHDKVTFDFAGSPPLTVLIQQDTGYISKMTRVMGEATLVSYTFSNHALQNGIPIAREYSFYIGSERVLYSFDRRIVVDDQNDESAFQVEPDIRPEPARMDQSTLTAEQISSDVFQVGQDEAYTSFVRTRDGLVAYGVQAGFAERLAAYRTAFSDESPLAFAVIPNHHGLRWGGVSEALEAGAALLVTEDAAARVRSAIGDQTADTRMEIITGTKAIGAVYLYSLATSIASQNLVAYHTGDDVLMQVAHYSAPFVDTPVWGDLGATTLRDALERLTIAPAQILSSEGRRADSWDNFRAAADSFAETPCFRERRICSGWQ